MLSGTRGEEGGGRGSSIKVMHYSKIDGTCTIRFFGGKHVG